MRTRLVLSLALLAAACGHAATLPLSAGVGPRPTLPEPNQALIPTVKVAEAVGWSDGARPTAAPGTTVQAFATGLVHPRWLLALPNGDVLVAETNAPPRPEENKGLRAKIMQKLMKKAGGGVPSPDRITLLRDADGDGVAERRTVFLDSLHSPLGMALVGNTLFIANTDAVVRVPYAAGDLRATARPATVAALPAGPRNHHWTKSLIASADGKTLYVGVGSNSNAAEHGMAEEEGRAALWSVDAATGAHRVFASGLRNPVGLAWEPTRGALWVAVNERDELGSDLVPDYMTSVREGGFYGWPYSYYGAHVDSRPTPARPDLVATAISPDYALGAHTASLGLAYSAGGAGSPFGAGMIVGQHGSWNRSPRAGYRVIFVPFANGVPNGAPVEVLTGFLDDDGRARGRPVGVALDGRGGLLVADDVGNTVWRVTRRE